MNVLALQALEPLHDHADNFGIVKSSGSSFSGCC
jgi:hypothetical protein